MAIELIYLYIKYRRGMGGILTVYQYRIYYLMTISQDNNTLHSKN